MFFPVEERDRVRDRLAEKASADPRIVAAAMVGSLALDEGDRWSDIDLSLGVSDDVAVDGVLDDWTRYVLDEFDAVQLFDLAVRGIVYRVFLLADWLQIDLSFTPASEFRQGSPRFRLLFGTHKVEEASPPSAHELFGWAVIYARDAHVCVERRRFWQAEHSISALRDNGLSIACIRHELPPGFGKGFDRLPADVLARYEDALVRSLDPAELRRALAVAVAGLVHDSAELGDVAAKVEPQLRALVAAGPA